MLLARITGFGGAGVSGLLFLFGVAAIFGNSLGGHGADRFAYARMMRVVPILLSLALLGFSVLVLLAGSALAVPGTLAVLALWGSLVSRSSHSSSTGSSNSHPAPGMSPSR